MNYIDDMIILDENVIFLKEKPDKRNILEKFIDEAEKWNFDITPKINFEVLN